MRAKDALASENAMLGKTAEKQLKAIETLTEARSALLNQMVRRSSTTDILSRLPQTSLEKELTLQVQAKEQYKKTFQRAQDEADSHKLNASALSNQVQDLQSNLKDRTASLEAEILSKRRLEEQMARLERQVQKLTAKEAETASNKTKPSVASGGSGGKVEELEQYNADLTVRMILLRERWFDVCAQKMLKCTSCQIRFKSHVITRCYHLCRCPRRVPLLR
jgi:E3 ubiquitin-protein ligase BRE1